jgi:hypothetical protein
LDDEHERALATLNLHNGARIIEKTWPPDD